MLVKLRTLVLLLIAAAPACAAAAPIRVAVFEGPGVGASSKKLVGTLTDSPDGTFEVTRITAEQIKTHGLDETDVLVHPGGSASGQGKALGDAGREAVRRFIRAGGGYLGVCAGAYLATNDYKWSLSLIDAKVVDRRHWDRGKGRVTLKLSPRGAQFFACEDQELEIHYGQGPLLGRREWDNPEVPDYESLAVFASEIAKNGAPRGVMPGTSAAVRSEYGAGRVFCFSPHPELTDGLHHLIPLAVQWVAATSPSPADPR